jgi:hypothetical protein
MDPDRWKKLDNLLEILLDHPPEERDAVLREACKGDEAAERELRRLLALQEDARSFLESPAIEVAAQALAHVQDSETPETHEFAVGKKVFHSARRGDHAVIRSPEGL